MLDPEYALPNGRRHQGAPETIARKLKRKSSSQPEAENYLAKKRRSTRPYSRENENFNPVGFPNLKHSMTHRMSMGRSDKCFSGF
ncbi:hypothetical protein WBP07_31500 [Novosphingobium sp. BL-8A]|uniref:hypothetical protein n=1 Tax=Novosphingobium sp. BL-8A TaxID=3127639 RepID=UPI003756537B